MYSLGYIDLNGPLPFRSAR